MNDKSKKILRIEPVSGESFKFIVESESAVVEEGRDWRDYAHRVDMEDCPIIVNGKLWFNGKCNCMDFDMRHGPEVRKSQLSRCKHIDACTMLLMNDLITDYVMRVRMRNLSGDADYVFRTLK